MPANKFEVMKVERKYIWSAKMAIAGHVSEQTHFKLFDKIYQCTQWIWAENKILKMQQIKRIYLIHYGKNMWNEVKLRKREVIAKRALEYGSETWALR
jgi:hypothetical protein